MRSTSESQEVAEMAMNQAPPERSRKNLAALQFGMITLLVRMVDGAGLLRGGVCVSFMSGNTTTAAVSLTKGEPLKGSIQLLTILLYVFGNVAGELIATASGHRVSMPRELSPIGSIAPVLTIDGTIR
jgi:uncharacterized membrane protein YoaK (UPF0700 family)